MASYKPLDGALIYEPLSNQDLIILAANVRIVPGVLEGLFLAAKDTASPIIFELAKSECNLDGGYTGMKPADFAAACKAMAKKIKYPYWALHADHLTVKSTKQTEISALKKLILAQIAAGYTSFAIDASFLFNLQAKTEVEQLADNISVTTELAQFIKQHYPNDKFGLEVEVGEIGKKNQAGLVLTTPVEAVTFLTELAKNDIYPHLLAIANGSSHGNIFVAGKEVAQSSINIKQTKAVAKAIKAAGFTTKIAQHGTTGTPLSIIKNKFPKDDILKGNVGTLWMNIVWEVLQKYEPEFYDEIYTWVLDNYSAKDKTAAEVFGQNSKYATGHFYQKLHNLKPQTVEAIKQQTYLVASDFLAAFNSSGSTELLK